MQSFQVPIKGEPSLFREWRLLGLLIKEKLSATEGRQTDMIEVYRWLKTNGMFEVLSPFMALTLCRSVWKGIYDENVIPVQGHRINSEGLTVSTGSGDQSFSIALSKKHWKRIVINQIAAGSIKVLSLQLVRVCGRQRMEMAIEPAVRHPKTFIGCDLGLAKLLTAVAYSEGEVIGTSAWSGRRVMELLETAYRLKQIITRFTPFRSLGTDGALVAINDLEDARVVKWLRLTAKDLLLFASKFESPAIIFEDFVKYPYAPPVDYRKPFDFESYRFDFCRLQELICVGAVSLGWQVRKVDPGLTSLTCSKCGYVKEELMCRTFTCPKCHASFDRDINAATNIASLGASGENCMQDKNRDLYQEEYTKKIDALKSHIAQTELQVKATDRRLEALSEGDEKKRLQKKQQDRLRQISIWQKKLVRLERVVG